MLVLPRVKAYSGSRQNSFNRDDEMPDFLTGQQSHDAVQHADQKAAAGDTGACVQDNFYDHDKLYMLKIATGLDGYTIRQPTVRIGNCSWD